MSDLFPTEDEVLNACTWMRTILENHGVTVQSVTAESTSCDLNLIHNHLTFRWDAYISRQELVKAAVTGADPLTDALVALCGDASLLRIFPIDNGRLVIFRMDAPLPAAVSVTCVSAPHVEAGMN
jgi:hypothetical protein